MKSILEGRPALKAEIDKIAEVAGYLWQNGWAERNGGNITVNITEYADDDMHRLPAISEVKQIGITLPALSQLFHDLGCKAAYNLDGGNSSIMVWQSEVINDPSGGGRESSDALLITEVKNHE